ncbi:hypothetical protein GGD83_001278 [Rhodoblastus sphagnicola]|uniref:hypothetical protein n=1 Tax=Rhodoblastus sphagnicola TaxID=333368 RepID=UPI0011B01CB6|nr:hypothetical protein [Rhodoblastus sphagnicola]MBB4197492.1 hypothetical protein [Rhodoblastus sphagnicola]
MQVSGSTYQYLFSQQRASATSGNSSSSINGNDTLSAFSSNNASTSNAPAQQQISSGYFGSPRATLQAVLASGGVVNTLSYLTSSDINLIQKTTGVTVKNGGYYDSDGNQVGIHTDSQGNLAETNANETLAAFHLAQTLSELRLSGGPQGDTSLQSGRAVTVADLQSYIKLYAAAGAKNTSNYAPDVSVIIKTENLIKSEENATT